jgi:signal transduction histidine kinase
VVTKLSHISKKLLSLGVKEGHSIEFAQRIRMTNLLALIPVVTYLYFIIWGYLNAYYFPVFMGFSVLAFQFLGIYLNYIGRYALAKITLFGSCAFTVFLTYNCLNIDYSITTFFFPLFIAYEIIFEIRTEKKQFFISFGLTILCLFSCFAFPKHLFYTYIMSQELFEQSVILNYIFTCSISVLFVYFIMRSNDKVQVKLNGAIQHAEQANRAKSTFLSNMSHELRTPLNGIIGATNLLMHEPATISQKKYYEVLQYTSDHMLHLINHILDFSKINEGKINLDNNVFNLQHLLNKLCRVYKSQNTQANVVFNYTIDEQTNVEVSSDDLRLKQVIYNLLSNAYKFTKFGSVTFSAICTKKTDDKLFVTISVKDTGVGIKQEQLAKIFESFEQADNSTTRNFGGTGLGLSISRELVSLFNAELKVESEYKVGTTFSFDIELPITQQKEITYVESLVEGNIKGTRILVAEDNKVNMMVLSTFLKKWEVEYTPTVNGMEALKAYSNNQYDLILLDLEMPEMDGYTAIQEIRKKDKNIPVIAFTAALYDNMVVDLKHRGFNDYMQKPFNPIDLHKKIVAYV